MTKPKNTKKQAVLVTTDKRGVFCGLAPDPLPDNWREELTLTDVRMAVRWSRDVRGVLGLASNGPSKGCRVTPMVKSLVLVDSHGVAGVSATALKAWELEPWG